MKVKPLPVSVWVCGLNLPSFTNGRKPWLYWDKGLQGWTGAWTGTARAFLPARCMWKKRRREETMIDTKDVSLGKELNSYVLFLCLRGFLCRQLLCQPATGKLKRPCLA